MTDSAATLPVLLAALHRGACDAYALAPPDGPLRALLLGARETLADALDEARRWDDTAGEARGALRLVARNGDVVDME